MSSSAHLDLTLRATIAQLREGRLPSPDQRRAIRRKARLSLRHMAALVGVTPTTIAHWEAGIEPRYTAHAIRYRQVLEVLREEA